MPIVPQFHGKKFRIVLAQDEGVSPRQCEVVNGTAHWRGGCLWLDCDAGPEISIAEETLSRVRRVAPELRGILGDPEYSIVLNAGDCAEVNAPTRPERAGAGAELASTVSSPAGNSMGVMAFPTKNSQEHPTDKLLRMV
jgi:hypothetical protein